MAIENKAASKQTMTARELVHYLLDLSHTSCQQGHNTLGEMSAWYLAAPSLEQDGLPAVLIHSRQNDLESDKQEDLMTTSLLTVLAKRAG